MYEILKNDHNSYQEFDIIFPKLQYQSFEVVERNRSTLYM